MPITSSPSNSPTPIIVTGKLNLNLFSGVKNCMVLWTARFNVHHLTLSLLAGEPLQPPRFLIRQDQLILSLRFHPSLKKTLHWAVGKELSREVCCLHTTLANPSFSSHLSLMEQLMSVKQQDNEPVASFLKKAKDIFDKLVAIGKQPSHEVFLIYILKGLRIEYKTLKHLCPASITLSTQGILPTPPLVANYAHRDVPFHRGRGRFSRGRSSRSTGRGYGNDRRSQHHYSRGHNTVGASSKQRCFVCESTMHLANSCPHRSSNPQANYTVPRYIDSSHGNVHSDPSYNGSTVHGSPISSIPWVPDTGASHHIAPDLASFHTSEPYNGSDRLQVASVEVTMPTGIIDRHPNDRIYASDSIVSSSSKASFVTDVFGPLAANHKDFAIE
ncbi:hypothetical protein Leryth_022652 [Lithospermum erythrorhizon]|nr:hypothetical protein Leryth_022652 [Lithospermum erythrorhizon]